jgi:hypothetical protein
VLRVELCALSMETRAARIEVVRALRVDRLRHEPQLPRCAMKFWIGVAIIVAVAFYMLKPVRK